MIKDENVKYESDVADTPYYSNKNNFTFSMYEELCEMIRGDSPDWTHEEVVEKLELAMDALKFVEEEGDYGGFIDWFQNNEKEITS